MLNSKLSCSVYNEKMQISKRCFNHVLVFEQEESWNTPNVLNHHVLSVARPVQAKKKKKIQPTKRTNGWMCVREGLKTRERKWRSLSTHFLSRPPLAVKLRCVNRARTYWVTEPRSHQETPCLTSQSGRSVRINKPLFTIPSASHARWVVSCQHGGQSRQMYKLQPKMNKEWPVSSHTVSRLSYSTLL